VNPLDLLLFTELEAVLRVFPSFLAVLARGISPAFKSAFFSFTTCPLQKKLHAFSAANTADGMNTHQLSPLNAPALGGPTSIVGYGSDILDHGNLQPAGLDSPNRRFTA